MKPNNEILIDYLDNDLSAEEATQIENMLGANPALAADLEYLKLAVHTVQLDAINEKVSQVRLSHKNTVVAVDQPAGGKIRRMYTIRMRVAAIFILLMGLAVLYKYMSVNDQSVYNKQFTGYELGTTRGAENRDPQSDAYQNKNWNEVIALFKAENNKTNKSYFLAGISEMQLNHFPGAILNFQNILNSDVNSSEKTYREEAEYYLSLAYLMNHEETKALALLNKIKSDTNHMYYPIASQLSLIDLKIIGLKK